MRRVGPSAVDDVVSEVFTATWRRIDKARFGAERAWMFGIARNVIRNQWRSDRRLRLLKDRAYWMRETEPSGPDTLSIENAERADVLAAMSALSSRDREILMLSGWDELSGTEIAHVLGISVSAAQQRLHRAKQRLADRLNEPRPAPDKSEKLA